MLPCGKPTKPETIFDAIEAKLASILSLDPNYVFLSLVKDEDIKSDPPSDFFVILQPKRFSFIKGWTDGGGTQLKGYELNLNVNLWLRLDLDQWNWDKEYLKNQTLGILAKWKLLLGPNGLEQFAPIDSASGQAIVNEPIRNIGFEVEPRIVRKGWGKLESNWQVSFTYVTS
jgi:hypothetical protein